MKRHRPSTGNYFGKTDSDSYNKRPKWNVSDANMDGMHHVDRNVRTFETFHPLTRPNHASSSLVGSRTRIMIPHVDTPNAIAAAHLDALSERHPRFHLPECVNDNAFTPEQNHFFDRLLNTDQTFAMLGGAGVGKSYCLIFGIVFAKAARLFYYLHRNKPKNILSSNPLGNILAEMQVMPQTKDDDGADNVEYESNSNGDTSHLKCDEKEDDIEDDESSDDGDESDLLRANADLAGQLRGHLKESVRKCSRRYRLDPELEQLIVAHVQTESISGCKSQTIFVTSVTGMSAVNLMQTYDRMGNDWDLQFYTDDADICSSNASSKGSRHGTSDVSDYWCDDQALSELAIRVSALSFSVDTFHHWAGIGIHDHQWTKFENYLMRRRKSLLARKIVRYDACIDDPNFWKAPLSGSSSVPATPPPPRLTPKPDYTDPRTIYFPKGVTQRLSPQLGPPPPALHVLSPNYDYDRFCYRKKTKSQTPALDFKTMPHYEKAIRRIRRTLFVALDEAFMIDPQFIEISVRIIELVRRTTTDRDYDAANARPFRIMPAGDVCQLEPISSKQTGTAGSADERPKYIFRTHWWMSGGVQTSMLTLAFRQKDDEVFAQILNRTRYGENTEEDIELIQKRRLSVLRVMEDPSYQRFYPNNDDIAIPTPLLTHIYPMNYQVDRKNALVFEQLCRDHKDHSVHFFHSVIVVGPYPANLINIHISNSVRARIALGIESCRPRMSVNAKLTQDPLARAVREALRHEETTSTSKNTSLTLPQSLIPYDIGPSIAQSLMDPNNKNLPIQRMKYQLCRALALKIHSEPKPVYMSSSSSEAADVIAHENRRAEINGRALLDQVLFPDKQSREASAPDYFEVATYIEKTSKLVEALEFRLSLQQIVEDFCSFQLPSVFIHHCLTTAKNDMAPPIAVFTQSPHSSGSGNGCGGGGGSEMKRPVFRMIRGLPVCLTVNIDTAEGLVNNAPGVIVGFVDLWTLKIIDHDNPSLLGVSLAQPDWNAEAAARANANDNANSTCGHLPPSAPLPSPPALLSSASTTTTSSSALPLSPSYNVPSFWEGHNNVLPFFAGMSGQSRFSPIVDFARRSNHHARSSNQHTEINGRHVGRDRLAIDIGGELILPIAVEVPTASLKLFDGSPEYRLKDGRSSRAKITADIPSTHTTLVCLPLKQISAKTAHSVQGCTLDAVEVNLSENPPPNMTYLMLGRLRSLDTLFINGTFTRKMVVTNMDGVEFDKEQRRLHEMKKTKLPIPHRRK